MDSRQEGNSRFDGWGFLLPSWLFDSILFISSSKSVSVKTSFHLVPIKCPLRLFSETSGSHV